MYTYWYKRYVSMKCIALGFVFTHQCSNGVDLGLIQKAVSGNCWGKHLTSSVNISIDKLGCCSTVIGSH